MLSNNRGSLLYGPLFAMATPFALQSECVELVEMRSS